MTRGTTITASTPFRHVSKYGWSLFLSYSFIIPALHNTTCVPYVGVFLFVVEPDNYTKALNVCLNHGGSLAHVLTEIRTNSLAHLVDDHYPVTLRSAVYVGVNETWDTFNSSSDASRNSGRKFITAISEPIQCFRYRAWAPGFPRYNV